LYFGLQACDIAIVMI